MSSGNDVRAELRAEVRRCLEQRTDLRAFMADSDDDLAGLDETLWQVLATQMGLTGLVVPEADGGAGASVADLAVVFEELGASLAPVPLYSTAGLALPILLSVGRERTSDEIRALISAIAAGTTVATVALHEPDGAYQAGRTTARAERTADGWSVSGAKSFVLDAAVSDVVVVPARTEEGVGLFAVETSSVEVVATRSMDLLRPLASVRFDRAAARPLAVHDVRDRIDAGLDLSLVLLAAEQVGGAQRCLDSAVLYAKDRVQFNRPIGSFQAIKHQLVNLLLQVEMARSAMSHAVQAADDYLLDPGPESRRALVEASSLARALCSETFAHVADEALHIHGGIGFTWEHDSHLFYRRAKATELLFGLPAEHRERLSVAAGL